MPQALLSVPYFSQHSSLLNPSGACNIISIAMSLAYFGAYFSARGDGISKRFGTIKQLADQLNNICSQEGFSRHSVEGLQALINFYSDRVVKRGGKPIVDDFAADATLQDIRAALDAGQVCVVHSYTTSYGHIFVIKGYKDKTFICNDPWGEWSPWTYIRENGANVPYSDRMIAACCSAFSYGEAMDLYQTMTQKEIDAAHGIWLHRIYQKKIDY